MTAVFVYLLNSLWPSRSKKLPHGLKHNSFPFLTKVIFLFTQINAVPHVRGRRAMEEIREEITSAKVRRNFVKSFQKGNKKINFVQVSVVRSILTCGSSFCSYKLNWART